LVEFKRFVHFFPESAQKQTAQFKIGQCLFYTGKYHEAAQIFNQIILADTDPALVSQSVFFQSRAFMHQNNPGYAQVVLHNYLKLTRDTAIKDQIYFNLAMIQISEARKGKSEALDQALEYLEKISPENMPSYAADTRIDMVKKAKQIPQKNPTLAGVLSIIPGGGFAYCGRYKDAAVTFLLNVGLMVAAFQAWENDNEALAGVIGFVETGFYSANIYGGVSSAHKYNRAQVIRILNQEVHIQPKIDPEKKGASLTLNFPF
ncbi:MAG: hypothetical protein KKH99_06930, partial [Proteobacteria bacterium]|nr:hypothetical protein [Pseudomonadota bacterium]